MYIVNSRCPVRLPDEREAHEDEEVPKVDKIDGIVYQGAKTKIKNKISTESRKLVSSKDDPKMYYDIFFRLHGKKCYCYENHILSLPYYNGCHIQKTEKRLY